MCSRVNCRSCGKVTWSGCGAHVDQVMKGVPAEKRCTCDRSARNAVSGPGIFATLFGRKEPKS